MIAATVSPVLGLGTSLMAWLVTASKLYGTLTVDSTGANDPMLAGNVAALLSPLIYIPILTYAFGPQNYDWISMKLIRRGDDSDLAAANHMDLELVPGNSNVGEEEERLEQENLKKASRIAKIVTVVMTLSFLILWPMPMYGTGYIFSKPFFTGWVSVGILWLFCSSACVAIYPLWEGRHSMKRTFTGIYRDLTGKKAALRGTEVTVEDSEDSGSPPSEEKVAPKE